MSTLTPQRKLSRPVLILVIAAFLLAGFAGVWWFGSKAAQNPAADLNHDQQINVFDLSILLTNWALSGSRPSDINADNIVNVFDLSILLAGWGAVTATPTPTPTPTPAGSCALPNFPDASCTGVPAGVTLTNYTGPAAPAAGAVIDGKNITTCMSLNQPGIIIKNSRLNVHCSYVVDAWITSTNQAHWAQIIDSEIICPNGGSAGIGERGVIVRRVEISGCENGMDIDQDALIEDSYIHTLDEGPLGEGHGDGIQSAILQNITIRHNTIIGRSGDLTNPGNNATSAIITPPNGTHDVLIEYNFLAGGAASIYCPENSPVNVRVINNTFAHRPGPLGAAFFYSDGCDSGTTFTGNVTDTGQPIVAGQ